MNSIRCPSMLIIINCVATACLAVAAAQMSVNGPRPLAMIAEAVELKTGVPVDYEDPEYAWDGDLKDVTATVAKKAIDHKVVVPQGGSLNLTFPGRPRTESDAIQQAINALGSALTQHHGQQLPGEFQLAQVDKRLQIRPVRIKDAAGVLRAYTPILNSPIIVPERQYTGMQALNRICQQVSTVTGKRVELGIIPINLLSHSVVTIAANGEPARDVLVRMLTSLQHSDPIAASMPQISWHLLYAADARMYLLNLHVVQMEVPHPFGGVVLHNVER